MKNVLIVGGTKGIGLSLANKLSEYSNVTVVARESTDQLNNNIEFISADATINEISKEFDSLDALVYCPGSINLKPFNRLKPEDFVEDFELNVLGAVKVIQKYLSALKKASNPAILLYSTVAVNQGMPFHASVAAAKGAIEGLGKSLAAELAPKVRVNVIAPSVTNTPLASKLLSSEDKIAKSGERHPLKRIGEAEDIANLSEFLLSEKSAWITGQVIGIDGGMSAIRTL